MENSYDWREEYLICQHVAENKDIHINHKGFRVCCDKCRDNGFLWINVKNIKIEHKGKLEIGEIINPEN